MNRETLDNINLTLSLIEQMKNILEQKKNEKLVIDDYIDVQYRCIGHNGKTKPLVIDRIIIDSAFNDYILKLKVKLKELGYEE